MTPVPMPFFQLLLPLEGEYVIDDLMATLLTRREAVTFTDPARYIHLATLAKNGDMKTPSTTGQKYTIALADHSLRMMTRLSLRIVTSRSPINFVHNNGMLFQALTLGGRHLDLAIPKIFLGPSSTAALPRIRDMNY